MRGHIIKYEYAGDGLGMNSGAGADSASERDNGFGKILGCSTLVTYAKLGSF